MKYTHITELIGNTPILKIDEKVHGLKNIDLYAKLEYFNPFGSVKDRIAWGMVKDDIASIQEKKQTIIEASSGNTAKALQIISSVFGISFQALTNRVKVSEVKDVMQLIGATVEEFPGLSECPDPTVPNDILTTIKNRVTADPDHYYHPSQYTNTKNVETHYETTGKEIYTDIGDVDYFIGGLGTTGSTRGSAQYLKERNPNLEAIGVVSSKEDFIPGIRSAAEMWEVGLFDKNFYKEILSVTSKDAIDCSLDLVKGSGVLAGPTSGAAYAGALTYLREIDKTLTTRKTAVFIVCDRIEWYVSYFQKRRPELFGRPAVDSVQDLSAEELQNAPVITPADSKKLIEEGNIITIDMRGNMAYRIGHIKGSINIPDNELYELIGKGMPFPPSSKLLFVCPLGDKSKMVSAFLSKRNCKAYSLEGGISAWRDEGNELESISQ